MAERLTRVEETPSLIDSQIADAQRSETALADARQRELVEADLLVEDVSIDGMCGVY